MINKLLRSPIKRVAKQVLQERIKECLSWVPKDRERCKQFNFRKFEVRKPSYGFFELEELSPGGYKLIGFVTSIVTDHFTWSHRYLHQYRDKEIEMQKLCTDVERAGGPPSKDALAFIYTIAQHFLKDKKTISNIFLTFQEDIRWSYHLLWYACVMRQRVSSVLFFVD